MIQPQKSRTDITYQKKSIPQENKKIIESTTDFSNEEKAHKELSNFDLEKPDKNSNNVNSFTKHNVI